MESTKASTSVQLVDLTEIHPLQSALITTNRRSETPVPTVREGLQNGVDMLEINPAQLNPLILKTPVTYALTGEHGGFSREPSSDGWFNVLCAEDVFIPPNGIKQCDSGVFIYINDSCFMQLDVSNNADLEVKTGVLDDTDCGNLKIILKNNGKTTIFLKKNEPMARIQFNKVNFPGPTRIGKHELKMFVHQLTFSRRQRRFVTLPSSNDDILTFEMPITTASSTTISSDVVEPLDLSTVTQIQRNPFGGKRAWGSMNGNCSDEDLEEVSDTEAQSDKRCKHSKPKSNKRKLCIYLTKGKIIIHN